MTQFPQCVQDMIDAMNRFDLDGFMKPFADDALVENLEHFVRGIERVKPATAKGQYIKKVTVSGTMTPGIQVKVASAEATTA